MAASRRCLQSGVSTSWPTTITYVTGCCNATCEHPPMTDVLLCQQRASLAGPVSCPQCASRSSSAISSAHVESAVNGPSSGFAPSSRIHSVYCSEGCRHDAYNGFHQLLCGFGGCNTIMFTVLRLYQTSFVSRVNQTRSSLRPPCPLTPSFN